ncbi:MAG: hypothetical protein K6G16_07035 [Lachnospiraceae bacterium]|nr:hypothetical protein [Lachnospiraceae bacterium]
MNQSSKSNTALFLMEMIVVICFFSLVAVICVRLFAAAGIASDHSVDLNHAVRAEESLAEVWISCGGDLEKTAALFPQAQLGQDNRSPMNGTLTLYYDSEWQITGADSPAAYRITLAGTEADAALIYGDEVTGQAVTAGITAVLLEKDQTLCSLDVDHYIGGNP